MVGRRGRRAALVLVLLAGPAGAADLDAGAGPGPGGGLRYFPRGDGIERRPVYGPPAGRFPVDCVPRRAPVPTNASDDPSYVGSEYGLSRPSTYGFTPPRGIDDPYGRSLRLYCP